MARDTLQQYRKKRDFSKTPEPSGQQKRGGRFSYLIQKHAASHLHYDFRLELDGALKSWAVPRGPSFDPHDKRLAMQVEDHPVAYGSFEGIIPAGEYGGGTVMLWDRGEWEPVGDPREGLKKGKLVFQLYGERLRGEWTLVKTFSKDKRGNSWLLIKHKDAEVRIGDNEKFPASNASSIVSGRSMEQIAKGGDKVWHGHGASEPLRPPEKIKISRSKSDKQTARLPAFKPPQLATLTTTMPKEEGWVHEIKFDGYRMISYLADGILRMFSRNGNDWTEKFAPIAAMLEKFKLINAIFDGELVVPDPDGKSNFTALKNALSNGSTDKFQYYVFDLLFLDGEDLTKQPLSKRKEKLKEVLERNARSDTEHRIIYSEHYDNQTDAFLQNVCSLHLEGVVSKRLDAPYISGHSRVWMKTKCQLRQEFVIGGFTLPSTGGSGIGALLLGYYDKRDLIYAGRVGTGFTNELSATLRKALERLKRKEMPFEGVPVDGKKGAVWVEPKLVGEIEFTEWTEDGHLRHPSFKGLREDKAASSIVKEIAISPKSVAKEVTQEVEAKPSQQSAALQQKGTVTKDKRAKKSAHSAVEGQSRLIGGISISHASRIIFPDTYITKGDLAAYYDAIASKMMIYVKDRPLSFLRCPEGIGSTCFFQRHLGMGQSPYIEEVDVKVKSDTRKYLKIRDKKGLIALIQWGVIELHPWECDAVSLDHPDRIIFDLDPDPAVEFKDLIKGAFTVKKRLEELGLKSFLKTTGGKGLHIVVPLKPVHSWTEVKSFAKALADLMTAQEPQKYVATISKAARAGKIFIDYLRNDVTSTAVAPFSVRARKNAPVSTPLFWEELKPSLKLTDFTMASVLARVDKEKIDPWKDFFKTRQVIAPVWLKALAVGHKT